MSEHELYDAGYQTCQRWVSDLRKGLAQCSDSSAELDDRQTRLQELVMERDQGADRVQLTIEAGEKLYPSTAVEGREIIRQQLR